MTIPRFTHLRPLPPYAFVPGRHPHPESDPAGHSFGLARRPAAPLDTANWRDSEVYFYGIDLFNAGYWWEAHVEFESLWIAAGRRGTQADFLKGLIKLAAAGVKQQEGVAAGVKSHACRAAELFRGVAGQGVETLFGLRLAELAALADRVARQGWPAAPPALAPVGGE